MIVNKTLYAAVGWSGVQSYVVLQNRDRSEHRVLKAENKMPMGQNLKNGYLEDPHGHLEETTHGTRGLLGKVHWSTLMTRCTFKRVLWHLVTVPVRK